jgi:hypothetical protein
MATFTELLSEQGKVGKTHKRRADSKRVQPGGRELSDCRDCKDYRLCIPPDWFNYAEIRFCPFQVIWIIEHAETLRDGEWPRDPNIADNNQGGRNIKTEAAFTKPILILAEVESRLRKTGINGRLLVAQIEAGHEFSNLDRDARDALLYIKGWRQKRMGFSQWKKDRKYYQKVRREQCATVLSVENPQIAEHACAIGVR